MLPSQVELLREGLRVGVRVRPASVAEPVAAGRSPAAPRGGPPAAVRCPRPGADADEAELGRALEHEPFERIRARALGRHRDHRDVIREFVAVDERARRVVEEKVHVGAVVVARADDAVLGARLQVDGEALPGVGVDAGDVGVDGAGVALASERAVEGVELVADLPLVVAAVRDAGGRGDGRRGRLAGRGPGRLAGGGSAGDGRRLGGVRRRSGGGLPGERLGVDVAVRDGSQAGAARRVRPRALLGGDGAHGAERVVEGGAHALEHEARELVGLQLDGRPRAARLQRVALEVMAELVGQDRDLGPVRVGPHADRSHELLVVEDQALARGRVDHRRGVVDVGGADGEVGPQPRVARHLAHGRLGVVVGVEAEDGRLHRLTIEVAVRPDGDRRLRGGGQGQGEEQQRERAEHRSTGRVAPHGTHPRRSGRSPPAGRGDARQGQRTTVNRACSPTTLPPSSAVMRAT